MYKHIIHKQKVVLEIEEQQEAFGYQNAISRLFNNGLTAAIENVLDEISQLGEVIRIESLTLELGVIGKKNFEKEFESKLLSSLRNAVIVSKKNRGDGTNNVTVTRPSASCREVFTYFLTHGRMPWYSNITSSETWQRQLFEQWRQEDWEFIAAWLKKQYALQPGILNRLVLQLQGEFLAELAENIWVGMPAARKVNMPLGKSIIHDIFKIAPGIFGVAGTMTETWKVVFEVLLSAENAATGKDIAARIIVMQLAANDGDKLNGLVAGGEDFLSQIETQVVKEALLDIISTVEKGKSLPEVEGLETRKLAGLPGKESQPGMQAKTQQGDVVDISTQANVNKAPAATKATNGKVARNDEDVEYVTNSGIILLHPFLGAYFADLELLKNKRFIDNAAHQRAVLLMHYLATGEKEVPEFNLVLQKILCGYPVGDTLVTSIEPSVKEIEESLQLLKTVVDYWPPLKNTSVAGFQTTFLQREGKLSRIESGWLLQVEQKTVDILLGKLPWGFSTIRLPWMQDMMNVEWA